MYYLKLQITLSSQLIAVNRLYSDKCETREPNIWFLHFPEKQNGNIKTFDVLIPQFQAKCGVFFLHDLFTGFAVFIVAHLWGLALKALLLLSHRIRQDRACFLKLALFRQFGSLPISYVDLEMKSTKWGLWKDDRAVSPSSWQSWSSLTLCFSLAVNLLSFQPITGCSCLLLIVSLKLKFVITYWCMASWRLWAWTASTALTALCLPSLCFKCPAVK